MSDFIQLLIAIIAGIGAIFAFLNIRTSNKQINLQQKQWEHINSPVFRLINITDFSTSMIFVIDNSNNVYHRVSEVTFSEEAVKASVSLSGALSITNSKTKEKTEYKGLTVTLCAKDKKYYVGTIQIRGEDSIGNKFRVNSDEVKIENLEVINKFDLTNSYMKNI